MEKIDFTRIFPTEIVQKIFSFLSADDLWNIFSVSQSWKLLANDDFLWRRLCIHYDLKLQDNVYSKDLLGRKEDQQGQREMSLWLPFCDRDAHLNILEPRLCPHAKLWGSWRWGTVQNWEKNLYLESEMPSMIFSDYSITSYGNRLALSDGAQIYVYTRSNNEIVTLHKETFPSCEMRDIEMNKDFLIVLRNTCVTVYKTSDYKPYLILGFVTGRLHIVKEDFASFHNIFDTSTVEFVLLNGNSLWMGEYLFLKTTCIIDLHTGEFKQVFFPWKCTLMRANENVIARTNTLLAVYTLTGEKSFEMKCLDYSWINTSQNVLALITDNEIDTYDRITGLRIGLIKKSFFEFHINYKHDLIYGLSKTKERFKVLIESINLLKGHVLWSVQLSGELTSEVRPFLNVFLCYDCTHSRYWYTLDSRSGKCLYKKMLPREGRIVYVSDLFWVCQTPERLLIRFY